MRTPPRAVVLAAFPLIPAGALGLLSNAAPVVLVDLVLAAVGLWLMVSLARHPARPVSGQRMAIYVMAVIAGAVVAVTAGEFPGWLVMTNWILVVTTGVLASGLGAPRPSARAVVATCAVGVLSAVIPFVSLGESGTNVVVGLLVTLATVVAAAVGLQVRAHSLRLADARAVALGEVRRAMAGELHDVVAHEVTGVVVLAQAAGATAEGRERDAFRSIEAAGSRALGEIRELVSALHAPGDSAPGDPDSGDAAPGWSRSGQSGPGPAPRDAADLQDLITSFVATTSARVDNRIDDDVVDRCRSSVRLAVHRVVAESLTNIRRHAAGTRDVGVEVPAPGAGAAGRGAGAGSGIGLEALAHRCRVLGGDLASGPTSDGGWRVTATLPAAGAMEEES